MSIKDNLNEFKLIKVNVENQFKEVIGEPEKFPKYTTQLINLANQNSGGTRPQVVGQMSELINICPEKNFERWKDWYLKNYPDSIQKATMKIFSMITKMRDAMDLIDEEMVRKWVEDLVITKTAEGLIIQEIILKYIAKQKGVNWRLATPEEESKNIDGFIGNKPVQIKPDTYLKAVREAKRVGISLNRYINQAVESLVRD